MNLLGAILAGGQGRRFGSDKALALLGGKPLSWYSARHLQPYVAETVICGRTQSIEGIAAIPDFPTGDLGPLGGLCAALRYASARGYCAVISMACDTPKLPDGMIAKLIHAIGPAYAENLPVIGYWPVSLSAILERHVSEQSDLSMRSWTKLADARPVAGDVEIPNINTVIELEFEIATAWQRCLVT